MQYSFGYDIKIVFFGKLLDMGFTPMVFSQCIFLIKKCSSRCKELLQQWSVCNLCKNISTFNFSYYYYYYY